MKVFDGCRVVRAQERHYERHGRREVWRTFDAGYALDPLGGGFGALAVLDEDHLPPGEPHACRPYGDVEIVTYLREGVLAYEDAKGQRGVILAGEFRRIGGGHVVRHGVTNGSRTEWAHVFHIGLRPLPAGLAPDQEHRRFSAAERRGGLCVVAAPDGRRGALRTHQDAFVYSALLDQGQHLVHELATGRGAWLHVVEGQVRLDDTVLSAGDGASVRAQRSVSFTAREASEVVLVDLGAASFGAALA